MSNNGEKTYLLIGGAGFIGINAADYFLNKHANVIIFDNFSRKGVDKNVEWLKEKHKNTSSLEVVRGDITVEKDLAVLATLVERSDYVIHLAGQVTVTDSITNPRHDFLNNAFGTFNVLESIRLSKKMPALIYPSTNKVYGSLPHIEIDEDDKRYSFVDRYGIDETHPTDFHSPYGCSKGAGDQYVRDYARIYGLPTVVCRQSCIYGPQQFGIEGQGWIAWFMIAATSNKPITLYGNGKQVRDLLYITDLVHLYDRIFEEIDSTRGKVFNVGGGPENTISILELFEELERFMGQKLPYSVTQKRHGDQPIYVSDISLLKKTLGWEPRVSMKEGVHNLWEWVQSNKHLFT